MLIIRNDKTGKLYSTSKHFKYPVFYNKYVKKLIFPTSTVINYSIYRRKLLKIWNI